MAAPLVRHRRMKEGAEFASSYCSWGASQIRQSVQDQRKFRTRSQLGPTVFLGSLLTLGPSHCHHKG